MSRLYLDTNILLHAKPLADITWEQYEPPPISIIITTTNLRELDHHKDQHPKKHIRERARRALQRIEASLDDPTLRRGVTLVVDDAPPRIDYAAHDLDPNHADDRLLASTIASRNNHPDEPTTLYTHDVGPRIKARKRGITAKELPAADKLPPSKDEAEAENERLRRELHDLKAAAPQLLLTINDETERVTVSPIGAPSAPRDDATLRQAADEAQATLPTYDSAIIPDDPPPPIHRNKDGKRVLVLDLDRITPPPDLDTIARSEYRRYENDRARYREKYEEYLRHDDEARERRARTIKLELSITNRGGKPAEQLHIEVATPEAWELQLFAPHLPTPPAAPKALRTRGEVLLETMNITPSFADYYRPDLNFRPWHSGPDIDGNTITWQRQSLSHGFAKGLGTIYLTAPDKLTPCMITYTIHAANAITPFEGNILITPSSNDNLARHRKK